MDEKIVIVLKAFRSAREHKANINPQKTVEVDTVGEFDTVTQEFCERGFYVGYYGTGGAELKSTAARYLLSQSNRKEGVAISTTLPDFAEQIKQELNLTPKETEEFLVLEVTYLAASASHMSIDEPDNDHFENEEFVAEYEKLEAEYDDLLAKASPRILRAMERYLRLLIEYYKFTK